jgi:hypothetical protein
VSGRILGATLGVVLLAGGAVEAQPFTWTGAVGDTAWSTPGNWTPAGPPTTGADATMNGTSPVVMDIDGDLNSLTIANSITFMSVGGLLGIGAGGLNRTGGNLTMDPSMVVVLTASQTWTFGGGINNVQGNISGGGLTLTKAGLGTVNFSGDNTGVTSIVLSAGTIVAGSSGALGGTTFTIAGGTLNLNAANNTNFAVGVTMTGATGTISALTAGNSYTMGALTVPGGSNLTVGGLGGSSGTVLTVGGLTLGGTITKTNNNTALWINGPYSESGGAAFTLGAFGISPTGSGLDGGLHFRANATMNAPITNNAGALGSTTILGADQGATLTSGGALNMGSFGALVLTPRTGGVLAINGTVSTTQPMIIRGDGTGAARFGSGVAFPAIGLTVDGATWETNANSLPTSVLFTGTSAWSTKTVPQTFAGALTVNGPTTIDAVTDLTVNGAFAGNGAITKTSAGTLNLTAGGSHSGGITMAANGGTINVPGTLSAEGAISVAANDVLNVSGNVTTSGVTVTTGGTVTGTGTLNGGVNVGAGGNFTPGSGGTGALTTGPLALADTTNLNFTIGTPSATSATTGPLTLDGILNITAGTGFAPGTYTLFNTSTVSVNNVLRQGTVPGGFAYSYNIVGNQVQLTVVPGPTVVEVASLDAVTDGRATQILWQAGSEIRNLGYRVFRQDGGRRREVSAGLIAGSALRSQYDLVAGRDYAFIDRSAPRGAQYWLQAIDIHGQAQWIGPVAAHSGAIDVRRSQPPALQASLTPSAVVVNNASSPSLVVDRAALRLGDLFNRSNQWRLAAASGAVKLLVRQDGVYRVKAEQLVAAGFPTGAALSGVQLWSGGKPVAFRASSFDGKTLQPGDTLEFFGQAADTQFTDTAVYWVTSGLGAPALIGPAAAAQPTTAETTFTETLQIRERTNHIPALKNTDTEGFFGPFILGTTPLDRVFSTPALAILSAQPATLEVNLQGLTSVQHTVDVLVNGVGVGTLSFVFQDPGHAVFTLPPGALVAGDNKVTLVARTTADFAVELSQRLTYPRQYAMSGPLRFTADAGATVELSGVDAATANVLDITHPQAPSAVATTPSQAGASLAASGSGSRTLFAYREQDVLAPAGVVANNPSSWHSDTGADLVIIGNQALLPSLATLADARRADGLKVAAVDIDDVYDEFSAGQKDATAIRDFLQNATGVWSTKPRFVLLAGAATYDPRGWLGQPQLDQVPTLIVDTQSLLTASDDALVTFDPTQGPALAVGRLPLSTPAEMDAAVSKILGRTLAAPATSSFLLVRDRDGISNFTSASAEVKAALSGWNTQDLVRGADDGATHTALLSALRAGPGVVDYQGHGQEDVWNGNILTSADVDALSNAGKSSLVVAATCLNAYFQDIGREALGSALLRTPAGGAWGVWASSGITLPAQHATLSSALLTAALDDALTLGEATLKAKQAVQDADIRATFHLLGDPSARAVAAKSPAVTTPKPPAASASSGCGTPGSPSVALALLALLGLAPTLRRRRPGV